ncbi:MAG: hypothetical protein IPK82_01110 [Polyangiaceae bacterium]|nr:hypothetical protein [Polyangiaceae bacterium]
MFKGYLDHRSTPLWLAAALLVGCGNSPPPKAALLDSTPRAEKVDGGASYYEGEIGGMNEDAVEDKFKRLSGRIGGCFESAMGRVEQIGGSFTVSFRVDRGGKPRWAYMVSSTIGDRATEACILDLVRSEVWPKPLSGEGLASKTIEIEPSKAPHKLDDRRTKVAQNLARARASSCKKGVNGAFMTTAYLEPDGRVRTVGVATPNEKTETVAECIVTQLQKVRFAAPGKIAKITFQI